MKDLKDKILRILKKIKKNSKEKWYIILGPFIPSIIRIIASLFKWEFNYKLSTIDLYVLSLAITIVPILEYIHKKTYYNKRLKNSKNETINEIFNEPIFYSNIGVLILLVIIISLNNSYILFSDNSFVAIALSILLLLVNIIFVVASIYFLDAINEERLIEEVTRLEYNSNFEVEER